MVLDDELHSFAWAERSYCPPNLLCGLADPLQAQEAADIKIQRLSAVKPMSISSCYQT